MRPRDFLTTPAFLARRSRVGELFPASMETRWPIPDTPHDLTKRERGQKYEACGSADLVAFTDESGEWHALQVIFEFKAPDIDKCKAQLLRYLSNEPMAKMVIGQMGRRASSLQATSGGLGLC